MKKKTKPKPSAKKTKTKPKPPLKPTESDQLRKIWNEDLCE